MLCFCGAPAQKGYRRLFGGILGQKANIFLCDDHKDTLRYQEEHKPEPKKRRRFS